MKLSVKVDYACRVLVHMARLQPNATLAHIDVMSKAEGVPSNYLVQILGELREGGLIQSRRGKHGGYTLARTADSITLYDVVSLIDGEMLEFSESAPGESARHVRKAWEEIRRAFEESARKITIEKIREKSPEPMYHI